MGGRAARPHSEVRVRQAAPWTESPHAPGERSRSQAGPSTPAPPWACRLSGSLPVAPALLFLPRLPHPRLSSLSSHLHCPRQYSPDAAAVACQARRRGVAASPRRAPGRPHWGRGDTGGGRGTARHEQGSEEPGRGKRRAQGASEAARSGLRQRAASHAHPVSTMPAPSQAKHCQKPHVRRRGQRHTGRLPRGPPVL